MYHNPDHNLKSPNRLSHQKAPVIEHCNRTLPNIAEHISFQLITYNDVINCLCIIKIGCITYRDFEGL